MGNDLFDDLEKSNVPCIISNIDYTAIQAQSDADCTENFEDFGDDDEEENNKDAVAGTSEKQESETAEEKKMDVSFAIGDLFDRALFNQLMADDSCIDAFGENGEFDTIVEVWQTPRKVALGL